MMKGPSITIANLNNQATKKQHNQASNDPRDPPRKGPKW